MKKLLTILLTLVMAVYLVNLNNSHSEAESNGIDYTVYFNNGEFYKGIGGPALDSTEKTALGLSATGNVVELNNTNFTTSKANGFVLNEVVKIKVKGTCSIETTGYDTDNHFTMYTKSSDKTKTLTIEGVGTAPSLSLTAPNNNSSIGMWVESNLQLKNISITTQSKYSSGGYSDGIFVEGNIIMGPKSVLTMIGGKYAGEYMNNGEIREHTYLAGSVNKTGTPLITNNIAIALGASPKHYAIQDQYVLKYMVAKNDNNPATPKQETGDMEFDTTKGDEGAFITTYMKESESTEVAHIINFVANKTTSKIYEKVDGEWSSTPLGSGLYTITNSDDPATNAETFTKIEFKTDYLDALASGAHMYKVELNNSPGYATATFYIEVTVAEKPSPTPSPSKKDESCEKVIGPTWHWNNTKGVCEDVGVVGTATR